MTLPPLKSIGRVMRPHGLKGELFIKPWDAEASWVGHLQRAYLVGGHGEMQEVEIQSARWQRDAIVVKFCSISSRNEAELLKGYELKAPESLLPKLEENEFYLEDLIGLSVKSLDSGRELGVLRDVLSSSAGDFLEVEVFNNREPVLVPFQEVFVPEVDLASKTIRIQGLDSLFHED